jgi:methylenetetrahydrofolate dehydrogenase (NADP+) / methenyltetrahydrofolate cyclohydrolase
MPARILSGKDIAQAIKDEVRLEVSALEHEHQYKPTLVVVRVGDDDASAVYVGSKVKTAHELGIASEHIHLPSDIDSDQLLSTVADLNKRADVDGILVQLPLPRQVNESQVLELIDPAKDVDGFHPLNTGRLMNGTAGLVPCTPAGVIEILKRSNIEIAGKKAVVIGRSNIVGKPVAMLLLRENATVTICHSQTKDLESVCKSADIIVAAIGRAGFVNRSMMRHGVTIIDVGINKVSDPLAAEALFSSEELPKRLQAISDRGFTLVGDVNPRDASELAAAVTPVPGGVGLLTVAMLMKNTVTASRLRRKALGTSISI